MVYLSVNEFVCSVQFLISLLLNASDDFFFVYPLDKQADFFCKLLCDIDGFRNEMLQFNIKGQNTNDVVYTVLNIFVLYTLQKNDRILGFALVKMKTKTKTPCLTSEITPYSTSIFNILYLIFMFDINYRRFIVYLIVL